MRLKSAIPQGRTDLNAATISRDDQCDFGKWLHGLADPRARQSPDYVEVKKLHPTFHQRTSEIVRAVAEGRSGDADRLMAPGSEWTDVSSALTNKMVEWRKKA